MDNILEVKDLKISFRTNSGRVKAVRDISFNLERGKTLAIVGESGSGKSVTSKAILGILAGNSIVEGGEILYDGQDLVKIDEESMHKIRGDKIAMIFQDPLSSLNPIVKIGKQITEAMLLKNKAARKTCKAEFNGMLRLLKQHMVAVDPDGEAEIGQLCAAYAQLLKNPEMQVDAAFQTRIEARMLAAIDHSNKESFSNKSAALGVLQRGKEFFASGAFTRKEANAMITMLNQAVADSIDRLLPVKDSVAYTFHSAISASVNRYFAAINENPKEEARYAKQTAKRERLIARGKHVDWKVVPKNISDIADLALNITRVIERLEAKYQADLAAGAEIDLQERYRALTNYFRDKAEQVHFVLTPAMARTRALQLMNEVGISDAEQRYSQYPFEFSGGMRQRIVIAIALAANPDILICDEPTTALDVTIQAQILELINKLKKERNLSVIFITHDLGVVANMADDIAVMYAGKIVEYGSAEDIFYDPRHPYTWALLSSMPDLETSEKLESIPGTPPNMIYPPVGDAFAARNKYALKIDFEMQPPAFEVSPTHWAATWLLHPDAPKVEMPKIIAERIARMKNQGGADSE